MYKSYIPYLQHILDECLYVQSVITDDMQMDDFLRDETLKRAVTRSLSIIGEATKKIPADVKYAWQSIYERCNWTTEETSVTDTFQVEGAGRVEAGEQVVAASLPEHRREDARKDGWTAHDPEAVGRTDGMQPAVRLKGSEGAGESFSRNHVKNRGLSAHLHSPRGTGDGVKASF